MSLGYLLLANSVFIIDRKVFKLLFGGPMAQISNIVVNNHTADVTFVPMSKDGLDVRWSNPQSSLELSPRIQAIGHQITSGTNRKFEIRLTQPFEWTSPNNVKSTKLNIVKIQFSLPQEAATADITALRYMASNLLQNGIIADAVDSGALPY
jgi:hypothetical protein